MQRKQHLNFTSQDFCLEQMEAHILIISAAETKTVAGEQIDKDMDIVQIQNYPLNSFVAQVRRVVSIFIVQRMYGPHWPMRF